MRIGINIPNDLMKRLEPLKPELNISQVCREALTAKAERHERMLARLSDHSTSAAVNRVWEYEKQFLAAIEFDWEMLGYEDAADWVRAASWDDWGDVLEDLDNLKERNLPHWQVIAPRVAGVKSFHDRDMELHRQMEQMREQHRTFDRWLYRNQEGIDLRAIEREYMTAWITYVKAVWDLRQQRLQEYLDWRLAQRSAPPEPEVPEYLFDDARSREGQRFQVVPHHSKLADGVDPLKLNHLINDPDLRKSFAGEDEAQ